MDPVDGTAPAQPVAASPVPAADASAPASRVPAMPPVTTTAAPPTDTGSGQGFWYDVLHPQPANLSRPQTWRDWATKTYDPSAKDVGSAALDDASFGFADPIQSYATGEDVNAIRARTAQSQAAMGPAGPLVNALTYAVPGGGEVKALATPGKYLGKAAQLTRPYLGRYGAAATEGGAATALSAVGHGDEDPISVGEKAVLGAGIGTGGQVVGDVTGAAIRRVADYVQGLPGRGVTPTSSPLEDLRQRALSGEDVRPEIAAHQSAEVPGSPEHTALGNINQALGQSTEPGVGANILKQGGAGTAGYLGLQSPLGWWGAVTGAGSAETLGGKVIDPIARGVNTIDRQINVNQAFDQAYPAFGAASPTTNLQPWADTWRQLAIGGSR
jgi:hypothetical protein